MVPPGNRTQHVLAIDLGSGGPKVAIVSEQGQVVDHARASISTQLLDGGGVEQDPDEWWSATSGAAQELIARRLVPVEDIVAIAVTGQWAVTVAVDRDGNHLAPAVHWMDARGGPHTRRVTDGWIKISGYGARRLLRWIRLTAGAPVHSGADALSHILFLLHERPDVYRRADKLLEPADYINLRLTGRFAASPATIYPYFLTDNRDVGRIRYDETLIAWSGIDAAKLPELLPVDSVVGTILPAVADDWGLSAQTQVMMGTCDSQAAVLGSGAVLDYQGHVCIGTSSWMTCHVPFKKTSLSSFIGTMPAAVAGRHVVVAEQGAAGKCLELMVERLLFGECSGNDVAQSACYEVVERLAASVSPGSDGLLFLPWLGGAGPPANDRHARGGFLNQSLRTGREHVLRAVMEGVACNLKWLLASVEKFIGRRFDGLNFIGGGARLNLWCQILADVLDRPIQQMTDPNLAIARGAALAALVNLGRLALDELPSRVKVAQRFEPNSANRLVYDRLFADLVASYKSNRKLFHRRNTGTHVGR